MVVRCRPGIVKDAKCGKSLICGAPLMRCTASGKREAVAHTRVASLLFGLDHDRGIEQQATLVNKRGINRYCPIAGLW
jgi:hypothetical protein